MSKANRVYIKSLHSRPVSLVFKYLITITTEYLMSEWIGLVGIRFNRRIGSTGRACTCICW